MECWGVEFTKPLSTMCSNRDSLMPCKSRNNVCEKVSSRMDNVCEKVSLLVRMVDD